ncbi:MAG TPA: hypothetical protein VFY16_06015 [Gemmatimonadaceae bacterium]|jgi:hypothetical protein|nr:hypothetical protein [Gemmatimonadaceae bacterium]
MRRAVPTVLLLAAGACGPSHDPDRGGDAARPGAREDATIPPDTAARPAAPAGPRQPSRDGADDSARDARERARIRGEPRRPSR